MATTYTITNTFTADTTAVASEVNQNFTDVLTALNALDAGNLASGTVPLARISGLTVTQLAAATIVLEAEGIENNDNDTTLATCAAIKDAYDTAVAAVDNSIGATTIQDDDNNTMLVAHAYLCNQDGTVEVVITHGGGAGQDVTCYDDNDTNPASGGDIRARWKTSNYGESGNKQTLSFEMASGRYFEITATIATVAIRWVPHGTLVKCTDQD